MSKTHVKSIWYITYKLLIRIAAIIIIMKLLDVMLEMLKNTQLHSLGEIEKETELPAGTLVKHSIFLQNMGLIEIKDRMLKITSRGLRFLELPV